ncbi:unnamed protein product [Soboliphyme baturini]|uniref:Mitochondrial fission 1 protein n=1 Tax=Soboliphyme baturini TaxID=241478 RepID=A0A183IRA3_9BILA|nr:unnamed protein product [Soboliphyme baturini]
MDLDTLLEEQVDPDDLKKHEQIFTSQMSQGKPSCQVAFDYAFCLIRSKKSHVKLGVKLLEELLSRDEDDMAIRTYLYYLAIGHIKLKNYDKALKYIEVIMRVEPNNSQAAELKQVANARMEREGLIGAAYVAGFSVFTGFLLFGAIRSIVRKFSGH